jgi:hypothetical protein
MAAESSLKNVENSRNKNINFLKNNIDIDTANAKIKVRFEQTLKDVQI